MRWERPGRLLTVCYPTSWDDAKIAGTKGERARGIPQRFRTQWGIVDARTMRNRLCAGRFFDDLRNWCRLYAFQHLRRSRTQTSAIHPSVKGSVLDHSLAAQVALRSANQL